MIRKHRTACLNPFEDALVVVNVGIIKSRAGGTGLMPGGKVQSCDRPVVLTLSFDFQSISAHERRIVVPDADAYVLGPTENWRWRTFSEKVVLASYVVSLSQLSVNKPSL